MMLTNLCKQRVWAIIAGEMQTCLFFKFSGWCEGVWDSKKDNDRSSGGRKLSGPHGVLNSYKINPLAVFPACYTRKQTITNWPVFFPLSDPPFKILTTPNNKSNQVPPPLFQKSYLSVSVSLFFIVVVHIQLPCYSKR